MPIDAESFLEELGRNHTAPYFEFQPRRFILEEAKKRYGRDSKVKIIEPGQGAIILRYKYNQKKDLPSMIMIAHMDHPGFAPLAENPDGTLKAWLKGGLSEKRIIGSGILLHNDSGEYFGRGTLVEKCEDEEGLYKIEVKKSDKGKRWTFATPHVEGYEIQGVKIDEDTISGNSLDDYGGISAGFATFDEVVCTRINLDLSLVLYRGEERGFIGLVDLIDKEHINPNALLISLEMSSNVIRNKTNGNLETIAPIGYGAIIRVGDALFEFDNNVITLLRKGGKQTGSPVREKLMTGGVCDAGYASAIGLRAAGVVCALGDYHNGYMYDEQGFRPEKISRKDFASMKNLLFCSAYALSTDPSLMQKTKEAGIIDSDSRRVLSRVDKNKSDDNWLLNF